MNYNKRLEFIKEKFCLDTAQSKKLEFYHKKVEFVQSVWKKYAERKIAVYGAGSHTDELMRIVENTAPICCFIDARRTGTLFGKEIIRIEELEKFQVDAVVLSAFQGRQEMRENVRKYAPDTEIIDFYDLLLNKYEKDIDIPENEWNLKYKDGLAVYETINKTYLAWQGETDPGSQKERLRELIAGYLAVKDFCSAIYFMRKYIAEQKDEYTINYQAALPELSSLLKDIKRDLSAAGQSHIIIMCINSFAEWMLEGMEKTRKFAETSFSFPKYIAEYPRTKDAVMTMFTGKNAFELEKDYQENLSWNDGGVIEFMKENDVGLCLIGTHDNLPLKQISDCKAVRGIFTEMVWDLWLDILQAQKRTVYFVHESAVFHAPVYNGCFDRELMKEYNSLQQLEEQLAASQKYMDHNLAYALKIVGGGIHDVIVMGDHGKDPVYEYEVYHEKVKTARGRWSDKAVNTALIINSSLIGQGINNKVVSNREFHKILLSLLQHQKKDIELLGGKERAIRCIPVSSETYLQLLCEGSNWQVGKGYEGTWTKEDTYLRFEDETEIYLRSDCEDKQKDVLNKTCYARRVRECRKLHADNCLKEILADDNYILHRQYYRNKDGLIVQNIDFMITEKCSLKCRDCFNMMQYYQEPVNYSLSMCYAALDRIEETIDLLMQLRILGGEPFMNRDIYQVLEYALQKKNIKQVVIYTNGTIMPDMSKIKRLDCSRLAFYVSDYGIVSEKCHDLIALLQENDIKYSYHENMTWYKVKHIDSTPKTEDELKAIYKKCWGRDCITLLKGRLFQCELLANAYNLHMIPENESDYVDLESIKDLPPAEQKAKLHNYIYGREYLEGCRHCGIKCREEQEKIPAGIQCTARQEKRERAIKQGTTYWITGLSGAGKTTIGSLLYKSMRQQEENIVLLDGDILRKVFQTSDYTLEGRKNITFQYGRLCKMLNEQGIDVIMCVVGMFHGCREWNRKNITNYKEIYLKVGMEELIRRDQKQLYSRALRKEVDNVMGIDIAIEEPKYPDMILDNSGKYTPDQVLEQIRAKLRIGG